MLGTGSAAMHLVNVMILKDQYGQITIFLEFLCFVRIMIIKFPNP